MYAAGVLPSRESISGNSVFAGIQQLFCINKSSAHDMHNRLHVFLDRLQLRVCSRRDAETLAHQMLCKLTSVASMVRLEGSKVSQEYSAVKIKAI